MNVDRTYTANALNQYTASGSVVPAYDGRGNLTSAGGATYLYNSKNQLSGANGTYLYYDPAGRLDQATQAGLTWEWDGAALVTERTGGAIARRYVHGAGVDEPVVWYEGAGTGDRRWLDADERGSIVRVTNGSGTALAVNRYDEYGIPGSGNLGRFQYTGQMWLPELGFYYYKARMYSPTLGRFMQTDPIGYGDGLNMYAYVGGDPVNNTDPTGMWDWQVTGGRIKRTDGGVPWPGGNGGHPGNESGSGGSFVDNSAATTAPDLVVNGVRPQSVDDGDIVVTARKSIIPSPEQMDEQMRRFSNCYLGGCTLGDWAAISDPIPPEKLRTSRGEPGKEERLLKARQDAKRIADRKPPVRAGWKGSAYLFLELMSKIFK